MTEHSTVYIWGRGAIGRELRAYLKSAGATIDALSQDAATLALRHGCLLGLLQQSWAWRLQGVAEVKISDLTRDDPSVMGWTADRKAHCADSIALLNALSMLTAEEYDLLAEEIARRYANPKRPHADGDRDSWVARDNRVVFFDEEKQSWQLGTFIHA